MATLIVCPRCHGSLQPNARACPRCGLVLTNIQTGPLREQAASQPRPDMRPTSSTPIRNSRAAESLAETQAADYGLNGTSDDNSTIAYAPQPQRPRTPTTTPPPRNPAVPSSVLNTGPLVPRGALQLLNNESVAFQLGALYLTNKRVILLAPTVVRAAFIRDIDAVGTLTERASGWNMFTGVLALLLAMASLYASTRATDWSTTFPWLYNVIPGEPYLLAAALALIGIVLLATYFVYVKRTLFVSVKGRPLITVSIADWNSRRIAGMDAFVNAFFQVKDLARDEEI